MPALAYLIGEFCPYCAGESWSVAEALSRFGTLHKLTTMTSSATDRPASIKTLSFRYATFHSRYLAFDPVVVEDASMKRVDTVPRRVRPAWHRYGSGGFPFLDFGGKVVGDTSFEPSLLRGLTRAQIAADLSHPNRLVARATDGAANQLTAAICVMTANKPGRVCRAKTIATIEHSLKPFKAG